MKLSHFQNIFKIYAYELGIKCFAVNPQNLLRQNIWLIFENQPPGPRLTTAGRKA